MGDKYWSIVSNMCLVLVVVCLMVTAYLHGYEKAEILTSKKYNHMIDFIHYDRENPQIWEEFVRFAKIAKHQKGFKKCGAKRIIEQIRWETSTSGNDGFKINNNYAPDYARKMEKEYPEFKGFFRMRGLRQRRAE